MKRLTALLISLWLGMHIGFLTASVVLFNQLEPNTKLAGHLAGILFHIVNWTGLLAWTCALLACRSQNAWGGNLFMPQRRPPRRAVSLMLALLVVNQFVLFPAIAALKAGKSHFLVNLFGGGFGAWHGVSYMVYLLMALLGLVLCIRLLRLQTD